MNKDIMNTGSQISVQALALNIPGHVSKGGLG